MPGPQPTAGPYPQIEPDDHGLLGVGDGNLVYWESCGNPDGKAALVLHGGPGSGCTLGLRRYFGSSRGTTLALAYAERHPGRVSELVLAAVVGTAVRREVEWITRDMQRHFPAEWARFAAGVPAAERDGSLAAAYSRLLNHRDEAVRVRAASDWCAWEDTHVSVDPRNRHNPRSAHTGSATMTGVIVAATDRFAADG